MPRSGVVVMALLAGCVLYEPTSTGPFGSSSVVTFDLPLYAPKQYDILFVIDSSPAMAEHAPQLAANYPNFINVLNTIQGGLPDVHLGVVTSDMGGCGGAGDGGRLRKSSLVSGPFIADRPTSATTHERNYSGDLATAFTDLATVGAQGCVYTRPLDAMRAAFDHPLNAGFLCATSHVAVIFVTATDDCSPVSTGPDGAASSAAAVAQCYARRDELRDTADVAQYLLSKRADPTLVTVSVISGPDAMPVIVGDAASRSCTWEDTGAFAAPRLHAFGRHFPNRFTATTICQPNLSDGLSIFAGLFPGSYANPCAEGELRDLDSSTDGVQPNCLFSYRYADGSEVSLPSCVEAPGTTCWSLVQDTQTCGTAPQQLRLVIEKAACAPLEGTSIVGQCEGTLAKRDVVILPGG